MAEKKKTEVVIGFESHLLSSVDKMLPLMEKADVILLENSPSNVREILNGKRPSFESGYSLPEFAQKQAPVLQRLHKKGKIVLGSEAAYDESWMLKNKDIARRMIKLELEQKRLYLLGDIEGYARATLGINKIREQERLKWIVERLPQYEGKTVYISAGEEHTALLHGLKKILGKQGIPVRAEFLSRGYFKDKRTLVKYSPSVQLMRMLQFKTSLSSNRGAIKKLVKQDIRFEKNVNERIFKYMRQGASGEAAAEKAYLEIINSEKSKSILKRIGSAFRRKR